PADARTLWRQPVRPKLPGGSPADRGRGWPGHRAVDVQAVRTELRHPQQELPKMKDQLLPPVDRAFSALIEDLEQRGMLDRTLLAWTGEFGRTPKINKSGGRDHWGRVYSTVLAGGGVRGGRVYGRS